MEVYKIEVFENKAVIWNVIPGTFVEIV
jgi:hypothetical protein